MNEVVKAVETDDFGFPNGVDIVIEPFVKDAGTLDFDKSKK